MDYTYLFPFEKIPQGSRIIIYGAGDMGRAYLQQLLITRYAEVVGFVDRAYDRYPAMRVPIYAPERLEELSYDYIVLAFRMEDFAADVRACLLRQGVSAERIVYEGARSLAGTELFAATVAAGDGERLPYAFEESQVSVALKFGPGMGDAIIKKQLVLAIAKIAPGASIDIYSTTATKFIPAFYRDMGNFHRAIDDGGALYAANAKKYSVSLTVFYMIAVDFADARGLERSCPALAEMAQKIEAANHAYRLSFYPATQNWIHFARTIYHGWNCFSIYNYTGAFAIGSQHVSIPLDEEQEQSWRAMRLGHYITVNYGNGASSKGQKQLVSKQWPLEYFCRFVQLFKAACPDVHVIQVGDVDTDRIAGADEYLLGRNLELVKYILKGALLHVDIEGGLVHLATQLGTKCICIFGPTQMELFAYPENINIRSDKCHGCWRLYDNTYQCARGLEKPECMYDITPERVAVAAEEYLEKLGIERI